MLSTSQKDIIFDLEITNTTLSQFECLRQTYDDIILWIATTQNGIVDISLQHYLDAKSAGLKVHVGFIPCKIRPIQQQIE